MRLTRSYTEFSAFARTEAARSIILQSHKTFGNVVIMDIIASHATKQSLVSLIRVSSYTFYSAIRYLWAVLPSAFYVLRLLPSLIFKDNLWCLANIELPPWELKRFDVYASNICEFINLLSSTVTGENDIDPEIFRMIYLAKGSRVGIFPRLRTLELPTGPSMIKYFATSSLTDIRLHSHVFLDDYIGDLLPLCNTIRSLTLHGLFPGHVLRDLQQFRNLLRLEIQAFSSRHSAFLYNFLNDLHQFPDLSYLICRATISSPLTRKWHCNLKTVELMGRASSLMHMVMAGSFTHVVLRFDDREAVASYHDCFEALARSSSGSLESVIIISDSYERHDFPAFQCLQPLFTVHGLRILRIIQKNQNLNIVVDDACLEMMAMSWPHLTQIQLLTSHLSESAQDSHQQPTIQGLRHLVALPLLKSLSIMSNKEDITLRFPIIFDVDSADASQHLLKYLQWIRKDVYIE